VEQTEKDATYYLYLGLIDDADEAYLNGHLIGFSGGMPPNYATASSLQRKYLIPDQFIDFNGENVLAVRVYDAWGYGGITKGKIGLYQEFPEIPVNINLSGYWKFKIGDNKRWKDSEFNDTKWGEIVAPGIWQMQGYRDYNGFSWYRKTFTLPEHYRQKRLILLLGLIDDIDETYLNGSLIGRTGTIHDNPNRIMINHQDHTTQRAYYLPAQYLKQNEENVIAIRVFDGQTYGGIKEGPVGIITREKYMRITQRENQRTNKQEKNSILDFFFNDD